MMILRKHPVVETEAPEAVVTAPDTTPVRLTAPATTPVQVLAYRHVPVAERLVQAVLMLAAIVCGMIAIRFLLLALGADMGTAFGSFMIMLTEPFVGPFIGLFGPSPATGQSVLELSSLFAMFIYLVAAAAVAGVIRLLVAPRVTQTVALPS